MRIVFSFCSINRAVLCCTLGAFTISALMPFQIFASSVNYSNVNINNINFGIRIDKLIEKAKKSFHAKDSKKLTEVMFDIKNEIEGYTGKKINLEHQLNQIEKEANLRGKNVDKVHMKEIRRRLKKQEKRHNRKAEYMATCLEYELPFNYEEESHQYDLFSSSDGISSKDSLSKKEDKDVDLPIRVTVGVTMSLVGLFMFAVPIPICRVWAPYVLDTGLAFLLDQGFTEYENQK